MKAREEEHLILVTSESQLAAGLLVREYDCDGMGKVEEHMLICRLEGTESQPHINDGADCGMVAWDTSRDDGVCFCESIANRDLYIIDLGDLGDHSEETKGRSSKTDARAVELTGTWRKR